MSEHTFGRGESLEESGAQVGKARRAFCRKTRKQNLRENCHSNSLLLFFSLFLMGMRSPWDIQRERFFFYRKTSELWLKWKMREIFPQIYTLEKLSPSYEYQRPKSRAVPTEFSLGNEPPTLVSNSTAMAMVKHLFFSISLECWSTASPFLFRAHFSTLDPTKGLTLSHRTKSHSEQN